MDKRELAQRLSEQSEVGERELAQQLV